MLPSKVPAAALDYLLFSQYHHIFVYFYISLYKGAGQGAVYCARPGKVKDFTFFQFCEQPKHVVCLTVCEVLCAELTSDESD